MIHQAIEISWGFYSKTSFDAEPIERRRTQTQIEVELLLDLHGTEHRFPFDLELEETSPKGSSGSRLDTHFICALEETAQTIHTMSLEKILHERSGQLKASAIGDIGWQTYLFQGSGRMLVK